MPPPVALRKSDGLLLAVKVHLVGHGVHHVRGGGPADEGVRPLRLHRELHLPRGAAACGATRSRVGLTVSTTSAILAVAGSLPQASTAVIRDGEKGTGRRVRIVAMTAHAMAGDRERCLDGGMDGYLSKPIDPAALFAIVEQDRAVLVEAT